MRKSVFLSFMLVTMLVMAGVSYAQTTVTVYDPRPNTKIGGIVDTLIEEFAAQNPDIIVDYVHVPGSYNGVRDKTTVSVAGGAGPNVVILEQGHWYDFALTGLLLPLNEFLAKDPSVDLDDYYPGMVNFLTWDDNVWGLPFTNSTPIMYYNGTLFEMRGLDSVAPTNWDEYVSYGKRISHDTTGDGVNDVHMIQFYNDNWFYLAWIGQNGGGFVNEDGTELMLNTPEAIEALDFMQSLIHEHDIAKVGTFASIYADFWAGNLAITEQSTAALTGNIETAAANNINLGVAPMACQQQCYAPIGGGNMHIVNTGTDAEKEAAWRFVSFMQQTESLARMGAASGYMAGRRSSIQTDELQQLFAAVPGAAVTYDQLMYAMPKPRVPNWSGISGQLTQAVLRIFDGANVRSEADELVRRSNEIIAQWYAQN